MFKIGIYLNGMDVNLVSNLMNIRSDVKKYKDCVELEVDIKG